MKLKIIMPHLHQTSMKYWHYIDTKVITFLYKNNLIIVVIHNIYYRDVSYTSTLSRVFLITKRYL